MLTTVTVGPAPRRYPHQTLRRFCSIAIGSSLLALLITFLYTVVFEQRNHSHEQWPGHHGKHLKRGELQTILLDTPSGEKAGEWSKYYTSGPHLAGKNLSQVCHRQPDGKGKVEKINLENRPNGHVIDGLNGESSRISRHTIRISTIRWTTDWLC